MKKLLLLSITVIAFTISANSQQIADNALGLRLGDGDSFGAEISYQRALSDVNRLEFGLGWRYKNEYNIQSTKANYTAIRIVGIYQWVWELDGNFNWYAGVGGGISSFNAKDEGFENETGLFVAGDIGIEYDFEFPLLLSLDFRPEFGFGDLNDDLDFDIALGVRYQF